MRDDTTPLHVTIDGALKWAKPAELKAALKLLDAVGRGPLEAAITAGKDDVTVRHDGPLSPKEWGLATQALRILAMNASGGAVSIALPELGDAREVRAGGSLWPTSLQQLPPHARDRIGRVAF